MIGVILGKIAEDALLKALAIYGYGFFMRPVSLFLLVCIVASIAFWFIKVRNAKVEVVHG